MSETSLLVGKQEGVWQQNYYITISVSTIGRKKICCCFHIENSIDLQWHPTVPAPLSLLLLLAIPFSTKCRSQFERKILNLGPVFLHFCERSGENLPLCSDSNYVSWRRFWICFVFRQIWGLFFTASGWRPGIGGTKDSFWEDSKKIQILTSHRHVFRQHTNTDQPWSLAMIWGKYKKEIFPGHDFRQGCEGRKVVLLLDKN